MKHPSAEDGDRPEREEAGFTAAGGAGMDDSLSTEEKNLGLVGFKIFEPLDTACWVLVLLFFAISSLVGGGDLTMSVMGAAGIVVLMFLVGVAIEVIIETLKDIKGLGTVVGFITNGPEALCLIVGLIAKDVLYAASTPLGSNYVNPLMLAAAALLTGKALKTARTNLRYSLVCIILTAGLAGGFFFVPPDFYLVWFVSALLISGFLFYKRPPEPGGREDVAHGVSWIWLFPAAAAMVGAGYLLDPVVSFTAENSRAPKGVIGFVVLSTLTSWPEFKSTLSLLRRNNPLAAVLNITVSNITNIWLAAAGVLVFLFMR
ncbi:MAG: sodium:proton exchanger [Pseudomonadota bacterium]